MFIGAGVIFLLVLALLGYALWRRPGWRAHINHNLFIVSGGIVLPIVVLTVLLVYVFRFGGQLSAAPPDDRLVVEVTAHQWWWQFRYLGEEPQLDVYTANELHIPAGRPVELHLRTADVIHTFWVPNLAGKRDMIPGMDNRLVIQADEPGLFKGQCNEFCGAQHALMRLLVISQPEADFEDWLARQRAPAAEPEVSSIREGRDVFMASGCPACHTVRGTEAGGFTGPDLTHFGSRRTIAAGVLRNTSGNRRAWLVSNQHIKPGNKMPEFRLDAEALHALEAYLGSLE